MNYPGNETLAEEIRQRILNTFRQTLDLAEKGDLREAQLGSDFVLRLDPMFAPARALNERLDAGGATIDVSDLRASVGASDSDDSPFQTAPPAQTGEAGLDEPPQESTAPEEPVFELGLDAAPEDLDLALDLSSLDSEPASPPDDSAPTESLDAEAPMTSEPVAALDNESERRVEDLLAEGQEAFEGSEYQSAIDAWSRIFLIDIDHPEANRRIDLARKLKAEVERKLEETYHNAVSKVEAGQLDEARQGFAAVLEMMPGHVAAQEYLARLDAPDFVAPEPSTSPEPVAEAPSEAGPDHLDVSDPLSAEDDFLDTEILAPPDPALAESPPEISGVGKVPKPKRSSNQTFKTVGAGALILLAIVSFFLYKNWSTFFPNTAEQAAPVQLDPITRAKRTHAEAGAAIAIAQLRRLSPGHPQYAEAQALVAQWEAALDASNPKKNEPDPEALTARDDLVGRARAAVNERRFLNAEELLERAATHASLDDASSDLLDQVENELAPMQSEIAMFREGEWELALRNLWRMWESGSNTPDVRRLMVDSYFNLGVRDLQRNDPDAAISNFREAAELVGEDPDLTRLIGFAEAYQSRSKDLRYRIFVKYLPFR